MSIISNENDFLDLSLQEQMTLCSKKIANFKQTSTMSKVISLCAAETIAAKVDKVSVNIYAILEFLGQSDDHISAYMAFDKRKLIHDALNYFGAAPKDSAEIYSDISKSFPTTVELNIFIHQTVFEQVNRINKLPGTLRLAEMLIKRGEKVPVSGYFNASDLRDYAILHYAAKSNQEKLRIISRVNKRYGLLLGRLDAGKHPDNT